ncbi:MAG: metal ABC transporter ATP-binding protein [Phycisphaerae bacterium]|nr:metal ABC transporter ATP-binding protein [Phycisphaerae bacterium]
MNKAAQPVATEAEAPTAAETGPAVSIRHLTVSYDGRPVLRSVNVEVPPGDMIGIIGPNGAGKSTLMKAILGLIETDSGIIRFFGEPIDDCRQRVAYVPQTGAVDWDFPVTVRDVVLMGRYGRLGWFGRPARADREAAATALDTVGMGAFARRHIRQLSGGQQQRVFLARALCQEADILLLDEPFAGIDAATEEAIFRLVDRLAEEGRTLLVVNHDLSILQRFDRLLLLNQRVVAYGPTAEVGTDENLRRTYGGRLSLLEQADDLIRDAREATR